MRFYACLSYATCTSLILLKLFIFFYKIQIIRNNTETTQKPFTDVFTVTKPNKTPVNPSIVDKGGRETHNVDKKVALPIWLIGVIAGGAVIATLAVTAIIWLCCKMKHK